jgi:hypothetical protein
VRQGCAAVPGVSGLYDCQGRAGALSGSSQASPS